jgi:hypothetical protein
MERGVHRRGKERNEKVIQENRKVSETGGVNGIRAKRRNRKTKIKGRETGGSKRKIRKKKGNGYNVKEKKISE